jgi:hypothetical protein
MKARIQVGLLKLQDPRVIRVVLVGLALALMLLAPHATIYACPGGSSGGCGGGQ